MNLLFALPLAVSASSGWNSLFSTEQDPQAGNKPQQGPVSLKPVGTEFEKIIAFSSGDDRYIWGVTSDFKLNYKVDLTSAAQTFYFKNLDCENIIQLQTIDKYILGLFKNGTIAYRKMPIGPYALWEKLVPSGDNGEIPVALFNFRGKLGLKTNANAYYTCNLVNSKLTPINIGVNALSISAPVNSNYSLIVDTDHNMYLYNTIKNETTTTNLGSDWLSGVLAKNYLYANKKSNQVIYRCQLPCEDSNKLTPYVAGPNNVLMDVFQNKLMACIPGYPLVQISDNAPQSTSSQQTQSTHQTPQSQTTQTSSTH
jgi:hypothetical protein